MATYQLTEVRVGDDASSWEAAGFTVRDDQVVIGSTAIVPVGAEGDRGILSISAAAMAAGSLDGIDVVDRRAPVPPAPDHRNGVTAWDHLVVMTPDADRTTAAFEQTGLEARRVRTFEVGDTTRRQTFFWLGDVILELVGPDQSQGDGPATAWGVALTCPDLDASVAWLGERCGAAKDAVQPGRRIATVRTRDLDISVPVALMTPHR
ncbi:MAG: VOC family protein [Acidimicrobiia bacterium]|nr:VOC family protein [Acidimicrobiia bacterium]